MTDVLWIDGAVERPAALTAQDLRSFPDAAQITDVRQLGAKRPGRAVRLDTLLVWAGVAPTATHMNLHAEADNFHASIPLDPVRQRAVLIYATCDDEPAQGNFNALPKTAGGPFRFFIPDHAACRADEIDECANVKFLDRIELTHGKGFDNRPHDEDEHAKLHERDPA